MKNETTEGVGPSTRVVLLTECRSHRFGLLRWEFQKGVGSRIDLYHVKGMTEGKEKTVNVGLIEVRLIREEGYMSILINKY